MIPIGVHDYFAHGFEESTAGQRVDGIAMSKTVAYRVEGTSRSAPRPAVQRVR